MQQLKQIAILLGAALVTGIAVCCYHLIAQSYILLFLMAVPTLVVTMYFYRQLQRLETAKLIEENVVLRISAGKVLSSEDGSNFQEGDKVVPVIVSVFGILAGNKIYKFNCDGIRLLSMKMDEEFIFFTYGTQKKQHHLKVLHGLSGKDDFPMIVETFRYETGVVSDMYSNQS